MIVCFWCYLLVFFSFFFLVPFSEFIYLVHLLQFICRWLDFAHICVHVMPQSTALRSSFLLLHFLLLWSSSLLGFVAIFHESLFFSPVSWYAIFRSYLGSDLPVSISSYLRLPQECFSRPFTGLVQSSYFVSYFLTCLLLFPCFCPFGLSVCVFLCSKTKQKALQSSYIPYVCCVVHALLV